MTLRNKLQKVQNKVARILAYSNYDVDVGPMNLSKLLGWKNLECTQQFERAYNSLQVSARVGSRLSQF